MEAIKTSTLIFLSFMLVLQLLRTFALIRDAYNYAWSRVRDRAAVGFGKDEARLWHRRVYGGLVSLFLRLRALEEE